MIPISGCAHANRLAGEDPIGTATPYDQVFLLQQPRPWAPKALDTPELPFGVRQALIPAMKAGRRPNVLLIDGAEPLPEHAIRVLHYWLPDGAAGPCDSAEYLVPRDRTADLIRWLSLGKPGPQEAGTGDAPTPRDAPTVAAVAQRRADPIRDVLICTHAQRDACCGRFGDAAYRSAAARLARSEKPVRPRGTRVWRVSHLGGHRFAPTLLDLPSGRMWGKLSEPALEMILSRSGDPATLRPMYRGWLALEPAAQVLERELLAEHGWNWLGARVDAKVTVADGVRSVRLTGSLPDGQVVRAEADVIEREPMALPLSCGADESVVPQYALAVARG